jgi:hypothetical protein
MYQPRARQRHRVGSLVHLEDAELPLHEGDDLPVVEVHEDRSRAQPGICRLFNAVRSESSRAWCEWGETLWYQESAFSFRTLSV